jgi:cardiolipin synthase A/B
MSGNNQITLLRNGTEFFPALEAAIHTAQFEIHIQTYIFVFDTTGMRIANAMEDAAQRGVLVCLLLDGFGSHEIDQAQLKAMESSGVNVIFYRPQISPWTLQRNRLRRMHRKVAVIDGRIGFVGGINIIDDDNTPHQTPPRIDYAVKLEGALLNELRESMTSLWARLSWMHLRKRTQSQLPEKLPSQNIGHMRAKLLLRDNVLHRRDIENAYLQLILRAKNEILIANAYFLPGIRFRLALKLAAKRGVKVTLLLQSRVEYLLLDYAARALYTDLLENGIEIYEYTKSFMHSKVAVVDHRWAMVGSSNIDPFSLMMAREANVLVDDTGFAQVLRSDLQIALETGANKVSLEDWQHQYRLRRWLSWPIYGLVRLLIGIAGYSERYVG